MDFAGPEGVLRGPAENGRISAVARSDVIDAAVAVLTVAAGALGRRTAHDGVTYRLTGPEALTLGEVADTITRVTGRHVRYEPESIAEAYASRAVYGAPELAGRRVGQHLHRDRRR